MCSLTSLGAFMVVLTISLAGVVIVPERVRGADVGNLINGKFDASSRGERTAIAHDVLSEVEKLKRFLPAPKPADEEWLERERLAIDQLDDSKAAISRKITLVESPELQHEKLFTALAELGESLHCAADKNAQTRREMLCWAEASLILTDSDSLDTSIHILRKSGRLPKNIEKQVRLYEAPEYSKFFVWYGRGMLEYIIIPYLKGDIVQ